MARERILVRFTIDYGSQHFAEAPTIIQEDREALCEYGSIVNEGTRNGADHIKIYVVEFEDAEDGWDTRGQAYETASRLQVEPRIEKATE